MRVANGLRKEGLGKALKVSRQTINAIETGRYLPSLQLAITLACFFGKPVEELLYGDTLRLMMVFDARPASWTGREA
jgi:putative transcriptional regulator